MRVTMLGISGAGKTTYMAGLAQQMTLGSVSGYTISPEARDAKDSATARANFSRLALANDDFKFPGGTMSTTNWSFNLCKDGKKVCFFEWIDFRGGYLDQLQDGINGSSEKEVAELLTYVEASDAVIIFIDSIRTFLYNTEPEAALHFTKARAIFRFLIDVAKENPDRTFILVGTKADSDIIPSILQSDNFSGMVSIIDNLFRELYTPLLDEGWKGAITCVGAIGVGRVGSTTEKAASFREAPTITTNITNFPKPVNVEIPLLFCLLQELRKNANKGTNSVIGTEVEISRAKADANIINNIFSKITRTQTPMERVNELLAILHAEKELLNRFKPAIPEIERIIRNKLKPLSP